MISSKLISELEEKLGYQFKNKRYLTLALTHSSYANEHNMDCNERLEFLGDAVLELSMTNYLYNVIDLDEGVLTKTRAKAVCEAALNIYASKIDFSKYRSIHIDGTIRNPTPYPENTAASAWTSFGSSQQDNRILYANISNSTGSTSYVSYDTDIDISSLTDLAYFGLKAFRGTSSGNYTDTRVANCYFEV